jgi:hypothetical protein
MTLFRPWPETDSFKASLRELAARLKRMVEVPTGYQDEEGFHFGVEPEKKSEWPPR